mmetsp:Transcript_59186/g.173116  ORF Transcript_59186/g.173116 Transcript_59186/m.173116 type:complete len:193 (+) Transcript_59186:60-638(+)
MGGCASGQSRAVGVPFEAAPEKTLLVGRAKAKAGAAKAPQLREAEMYVPPNEVAVPEEMDEATLEGIDGPLLMKPTAMAGQAASKESELAPSSPAAASTSPSAAPPPPPTTTELFTQMEAAEAGNGQEASPRTEAPAAAPGAAEEDAADDKKLHAGCSDMAMSEFQAKEHLQPIHIDGGGVAPECWSCGAKA